MPSLQVPGQPGQIGPITGDNRHTNQIDLGSRWPGENNREGAAEQARLQQEASHRISPIMLEVC